MRGYWRTESSFATSRDSQTHMLVEGRLEEGKPIIPPLYVQMSPAGGPGTCFSAPGSQSPHLKLKTEETRS